MKVFFSMFLFIAFSLNASLWGQKTMMAYEKGKEPKDKVLISGGKPVFVIAISPNAASDSFITDREKKELEQNFKNLQPDVKVEYTDVIIFKNKNIKKFDFQKLNDKLERIIYWDGKVESDPVVYDGLMNATEFFAQELDLDVVSSYNVDFEILKSDYLTPPEEKITKRSKEVSDFFLNKSVMSVLFYLEKGSENFYKMNFKGIKSIKAVPSKLVDDVVPMEVIFNEDGLPIKMKYGAGKKIKSFDLIYEDGLIRNFLSDERLYFVDDKIITIDQDSRTVYARKDKDFLVSRYDTFLDDTKTVYWTQVDIVNNIISFKQEGGLNNTTYELASRKNIFPVIHRVAHSEKDNLIEKKGLEIIETYHPDNKIFIWTINEKGLIEKFSVNDQRAKEKIEITYLYEYYK